MSDSLRTTYYVARLGRWLSLVWLALGLASAAHATGPGPASATPSLASALNPDGTLRAGVSGSFDARQFVLEKGPDGRPVFRPAGVARTAGTGDEKWADGFRISGTNAGLLAVVRIGTDTYVGGRFGAVGTIKANNVAKWNGSTWSALGTGLGTSGSGSALAVSGTALYVGGTFIQAGAVSALNVAR